MWLNFLFNGKDARKASDEQTQFFLKFGESCQTSTFRLSSLDGFPVGLSRPIFTCNKTFILTQVFDFPRVKSASSTLTRAFSALNAFMTIIFPTVGKFSETFC